MTITPCRLKWNGTMTDRERFNNQMHYLPVDRCFNMEFGYWDENYQTWEAFLKNNITTEEQANVFFNFDKIEIIRGLTWMHPSFEVEVIGEENGKQTIRNHDGLLAEVLMSGKSTIPHYTKATVVTPEDWKQVKEERFVINHPNRTFDVDAILKATVDVGKQKLNVYHDKEKVVEYDYKMR